MLFASRVNLSFWACDTKQAALGLIRSLQLCFSPKKFWISASDLPSRKTMVGKEASLLTLVLGSQCSILDPWSPGLFLFFLKLWSNIYSMKLAILILRVDFSNIITFSILRNRHHCLIPKCFHHPNRKLCSCSVKLPIPHCPPCLQTSLPSSLLSFFCFF